MIRPALTAGEVTQVAPAVRRLIAPNPGMMTGPGTNTYLLGDDEIAVLDPGPLLDVHVDAIMAAAPGPIRWILVTHTHPDHSPAAARLAVRCGAELLGRAAPSGAMQDQSFVPDRTLADGDRLETPEFTLQAVHTPGHASNHLCYLHEHLRWLFTGDHIMNGSTVVIDPPDGNMAHYLDSLDKLRRLDLVALAPGHGEVIHKPDAAITWLLDHRHEREAKVMAALLDHPDITLDALTAFVYADVDTSLHPIASRSLLAHLLKLEADGRVSVAGDRWQPGPG